METAGGIGDDHVIAPGGGRLHGVEDNGSRVCALAGLDDRHTGAARPDLQLLAGSGAEGVACGQHDLFALTGVVVGQLCDAGGLAHAVDANDEDDGGMAVQRHFGLRAHLVGDDVAQSVSRLFAGLEALFLHAVAEGVHQLHGDVAAHVGEDELFFQLIVEVVVDLAAGEGVQDVAPKARAGLFEAVFHFVLFFFAKSKESHGFSP